MNIDTQHIVGVSEVARMANVTKQAVSNWTVRYTDFPKPIKELAAGPLYDSRQIVVWMVNRDVLRIKV